VQIRLHFINAAAGVELKEQDSQTSLALYVTELKWRLFVSLVAFPLFYTLDQSVRLFVDWHVGLPERSS
jgi:hypothetical protein